MVRFLRFAKLMIKLADISKMTVMVVGDHLCVVKIEGLSA